MSESTSTTFGSIGDRVTYLLAEAQLVVIGVAFSLGAALLIFRPSLPSVPPIVVGWFAVLLLFGPPLFGFFVGFVRRLRNRHMISVWHVDATQDLLKKYYVEPEVWADKSVDGPQPYPVNGGSGWAVREFEHLEDVDELRVSGVWLSECEDTKLLTKKSHMESIYDKLTQSHIAFKIMRESISELGADIQGRIINEGAESREKGTLMDENAVKDVFGEYEQKFQSVGVDELPHLDLDELANEAVADEPSDQISMGMGDQSSPEAVADD